MFKRNLGGREFYQFPSVAALRENGEICYKRTCKKDFKIFSK
ncbi:hypothetical protein T08_12155 [Trichinella sp. T8]|nr:hypothetical protein T08_12155 [Trichinella sp. T8]